MGMTLAERSFNQKLKYLLGEGRRKPDPGPMFATSLEAAEKFRRELTRPLPLDLEKVAKVFRQYGTYLELIGCDTPNRDLVKVGMTYVPKMIERHPHPEDLAYEAWCLENSLNPVDSHWDAFWLDQEVANGDAESVRDADHS